MAVDANEEIEALLNRLRRLEGQVRGIQRMLEEGRHCEDVLTQIQAVRSGADQVARLMLDHHLACCVLADVPLGEGQLDEIRNALRLWLRAAPAGEP